MIIKFIIQESAGYNFEANTCYLYPDNWDDYSFKTKFSISFCDHTGLPKSLGTIKIGKANIYNGWVKDHIQKEFTQLDDSCFSLGQDEGYYHAIRTLDKATADQILSSLNDLSFHDGLINKFKDERILLSSLLRFVSLTSIEGQFKRILEGKSPLTDFNFHYIRTKTERMSALCLNFNVKTNSRPNSNINVLIGRNGVGKTTIFNGIVKSVIAPHAATLDDGQLQDSFGNRISSNFFSSIISVSFSAFDPFVPPENRNDRSLGTCYYYVGLKKIVTGQGNNPLKNYSDLANEIANSIRSCFSIPSKKERWLNGIMRLESDSNFTEMNLGQLKSCSEENVKLYALPIVTRMSSGHMIVLLILSKLVEFLEEKSLVLIDEPECHLHPPLLSALIRATSELLIDRNAVALIATHSPVVLQEVPKSCSWILDRTRLEGKSFRPEIETFGENVGTLTRQVFGLEVVKSGFYDLLFKDVTNGKTYDEILTEYDSQIGFEGRALLKSLIAHKN